MYDCGEIRGPIILNAHIARFALAGLRQPQTYKEFGWRHEAWRRRQSPAWPSGLRVLLHRQLIAWARSTPRHSARWGEHRCLGEGFSGCWTSSSWSSLWVSAGSPCSRSSTWRRTCSWSHERGCRERTVLVPPVRGCPVTNATGLRLLSHAGTGSPSPGRGMGCCASTPGSVASPWTTRATACTMKATLEPLDVHQGRTAPDLGRDCGESGAVPFVCVNPRSEASQVRSYETDSPEAVRSNL